MKHPNKSTPKAMVLNYHYHYTCFRNIHTLMNHETFGPMWNSLTAEERTYVLKGGNRGSKR